MSLRAIFGIEPSPERSSIALLNLNRLLSPEDPKIQNSFAFKNAVEQAKGWLKDLASVDRDQALVDLLKKWAPKGDHLEYQALSKLNYLVWKLDPSQSARSELTPIVEEIYIKYLKQGAFPGFPSCNPELGSLNRLLSQPFKSSDQAYEAAREGLNLKLKTGGFHEYLFKYVGFDRFQERLLQDEQVRTAARDGLNLLAARGELKYESAYQMAELFKVTDHLASEQLVASVKNGIRDLLTKNPGRWLGRLRDGSEAFTEQVTLSSLNEMALFLPWGDVRRGNVPSETREFVAEIKPVVRERVLGVIRNDVRRLLGGNDAEDISFTVELFLGNGFYNNKETLQAIRDATINRVCKFQDLSKFNQNDPSQIWKLLAGLPSKVVDQLKQQTVLTKAVRKTVGELLSKMGSMIKYYQACHEEGCLRSKELKNMQAEELARNYACPIIILSRTFGLKEPELPQVPGLLLKHYQVRRTALLCANDQCLADDQAALAQALQNASGPTDRSLVAPLEKLAAKSAILNKYSFPSTLALQAERISYLHDPSDVPRQGFLKGVDDGRAKALLASTYRSFAMWRDLNRSVDRRILIYMANALEESAANARLS